MEIVRLDLPGIPKLASGKVREIFDLGDQLLDALATVHAVGLAHHEVQPRHVLIEQDRYLLDGFGSAGPATRR